MTAEPLIAAPDIAPLLSLVLILLTGGVGFLWAMRAQTFDESFSILLTATVLITPIVWAHYFVFLSLPIFLQVRSLASRGWPDHSSLGLAVICLLLVIPPYLYDSLVISLYQGRFQTVMVREGLVIAPGWALLTSIPLAGLLGLFILQNPKLS